MISGFRNLLQEDSLVDVTLAADGYFVQAHRLVLSVCSPYFKELFSVNPCNHPIVILKDVKSKQLTDILSFIYQGEVSVRQEDLQDFLKTAELLQIRGLAEQRLNKDRHAKIDKSTSCKINELGRPSEAQAMSQGTRGKIQPLSRLNPVLGEVTSEESISLEDSNTGVTIEGVTSVTDSTSMSSAKQIHMHGHSSPPVLLRIPIKQEIPDTLCDFEQDAHVVETEEFTPTEAHGNQEEQRGSSTSGAALPRVKDMKALIRDNPILPKKTTRKQRMIALNKIRRFLVTPKRSRRIAHRMKRRKDLIVKATQNADIVDDVSKSLPAFGKHDVNIKNNSFDSAMKENSLFPEKNNLELALPLVRPEEQVTNNGEFLGNVCESKHPRRKKIPGVSFLGTRSKKRRRKRTQKKDHESSLKSRSDLSYENVSLDGDISSPPENKPITNPDRPNMPIIVEGTRKRNAALNKKKMIVLIAAKKTKTAVALARKTKSNLTLSEKTNSPEVLSYKNDESSIRVHSPVRGKISKPVFQNENGVEKVIPTTILRSSVPNSSVSISTTGMNGEACRDVGCVGCREGN